MSNDNKSQDDGIVCPVCNDRTLYVTPEAYARHRATHGNHEDTEALRSTVVDTKPEDGDALRRNDSN